MAVTKIGQNLWQIRISVRVSGIDQPVKKQEQFTGTKIETQLRESELIQAVKILHTSSRSLKLEQKSIKNFQDILDLHIEKLEAEGTLSKPHKRKIDFIEKELGHILISEFADISIYLSLQIDLILLSGL